MEPLIFPHQIENIGPMTRYMKNLFPFCGVKNHSVHCWNVLI